MRKLFTLIVAAILLFGCEGPMGPPGEGTNWNIKDWTVTSSQWKLSGAPNSPNSFYYVDLVDGNLTPFIASSGNVFVYLYTEKTTSGWVQAPLPYITHKSDGTNLWTETYDFDYTAGSIRLYVQYSDFATQIPPPSSTFRVVLNW